MSNFTATCSERVTFGQCFSGNFFRNFEQLVHKAAFLAIVWQLVRLTLFQCFLLKSVKIDGNQTCVVCAVSKILVFPST